MPITMVMMMSPCHRRREKAPLKRRQHMIATRSVMVTLYMVMQHLAITWCSIITQCMATMRQWCIAITLCMVTMMVQ